MSGELKTVYGTLPATTRGVPVHLGGDPKGKNFLYTNGHSVFIRDINNPMIVDTYNEHQVNATVARYSPSGFYIASGDESGKIRIWDTVNKEHILKYEYRPLSGAIKDIGWSEDSKRIVAVGDGRESFASVFLWDSGSTVGEILGHNKAINSVAFKQQRPYRIATAGEDCITNLYEGPPFKITKSNISDHTRFANCVRFNHDGSKYLTVGSDAKGFFYDGKTGEKIGELGDASNKHTGSIMSLSWSADGSQVITASADKTAKLWDVARNVVVSTFTFGDAVEDQQLGTLWQGSHILTVSLSGYINYLDVNNPNKPLRILKGHNKSINSLSIASDRSTFYSGSYDGRITAWNYGNGENDIVQGKGHTNDVTQLRTQGDKLVSISADDSIRFTDSASKTYSDDNKVGLPSVPHGLGVSKSNIAVVACHNSVELLRNGKKASSINVAYEPQAAAINPAENQVAVGGKDGKLYVYTLNGDSLVEKTQLESKGPVTSVAYSGNGLWLAVGDTQRNIYVYEASSLERKITSWVFHSARVNAIAWSADNRHLASVGLDTSIYVWDVEQPNKRVHIKNAHPGNITCVEWLDENTLLTAGQDCCVRSWTIKY
ncbi:WDR1 protein [Capsaspora owczarzaki ATCC 30864]|uniref:WDR1 protein n=1 Tax=Capsaspora owczarzaki (strain ATCC 30864) TaxID=595528 RepID=A0A0D2WR62_CAPO3|nr:WDR1 protein [Capsaspora owczarzaki ATCC 30864]KJE94355.1 WDR1 protein [Capsaspora owczarzaki ATCC 30864]|eukprot:XP_004346695.1 WDR1 protein [Capsaspora owczarzaki ATCC 30864]